MTPTISWPHTWLNNLRSGFSLLISHVGSKISGASSIRKTIFSWNVQPLLYFERVKEIFGIAILCFMVEIDKEEVEWTVMTLNSGRRKNSQIWRKICFVKIYAISSSKFFIL